MTSGAPAPNPRARATGFLSAALLVVLLATTGLPVDAPHLRDAQQVTCCEVQQARSAFCSREPEERAGPEAAVREVALPRVAPRAARVDSWGLPPARADEPTLTAAVCSFVST